MCYCGWPLTLTFDLWHWPLYTDLMIPAEIVSVTFWFKKLLYLSLQISGGTMYTWRSTSWNRKNTVLIHMGIILLTFNCFGKYNCTAIASYALLHIYITSSQCISSWLCWKCNNDKLESCYYIFYHELGYSKSMIIYLSYMKFSSSYMHLSASMR